MHLLQKGILGPPLQLALSELRIMRTEPASQLLGHRAHTEEILSQTRATDQWSYYQAKNMRRNNLEALDTVLTALQNTDATRRLGTVTLEDGGAVKCFIGEPYAIAGSEDITAFAGWRNWLNRERA